MKLKKQLGEKTFIIITLLLLLFPAISAQAQKIFDSSNPAGKYIITDYQNRKIILNIGKTTAISYGMPKGTGTITINGRTLNGNWNVTDFNDAPYLAFETYDNIRIVYSLPSGSAKTDQIIISQDGRASYNISELLKNDANWIKAKRATGTSKMSSFKITTNKK